MAGRLTSPRTLVVGSLNVRGCSSIESKRSEIGCMFGRRGMDVLALCETKMKGKGEVAFGEVTGRVSGVERGRAREGVALLLSEWMENKVVEWKEVSSRLMWVRVRMGRECWAFVSAYGPACERSEEERDEFWNDLTRCVDGLTTRNYVDRVRNEVVRARTGVRRELAARVDVNVLRWFGHVERMDNERLLKKVMNAKVDGRSARGRPRFGWMDGVKRALNDRRMDIREASERARNRNEWRMIVTQF